MRGERGQVFLLNVAFIGFLLLVLLGLAWQGLSEVRFAATEALAAQARAADLALLAEVVVAADQNMTASTACALVYTRTSGATSTSAKVTDCSTQGNTWTLTLAGTATDPSGASVQEVLVVTLDVAGPSATVTAESWR
jgi:hypothetical protein